MDSVDLDLELDNYLLHPQPQHSLKIVHAFMCADRVIEHVCTETVSMEDGVLRQEQLIWCIKRQQQQQRALSNLHFKLRAMFLYNMDLAPEELRDWLHAKEPQHEFLAPISAVEDVTVQPTIPMFASMNALYIMYEASPRQQSQQSQQNHSHNQSKKRIVIHSHHSKKHKSTRRA